VSNFVDGMRRRLNSVAEGECPGDEAFASSYPGLHEFLGRTKLADGSPRARSKLTLFYDGPWFKATLTEPDAECSAFVTSDSFLGVLSALEDGVQSETLDWRRWWAGGKARKLSSRG